MNTEQLSAQDLVNRVRELEQECAKLKDLLVSHGQFVAAAQMRDAESGLHKTLSCWNHSIYW